MSLPAGQVANAASSSASSSSSSHRPQPAKLDDVAARLTDGKLDISKRLSAAYELRECAEHYQTHDYLGFIKLFVPAFISAFASVQPSFKSDAPEHRLRHALLETMRRVPNFEPVRKFAKQLMPVLLNIVKEDNEENGEITMKVLSDMLRSGKEECEEFAMPFFELIQGLFVSMKKTVDNFFGVKAEGSSDSPAPAAPSPAEGGDAAAASTAAAAAQSSSSSTSGSKTLASTHGGFKILAECPIAVVLVLQTYSSIMRPALNGFIPVIFDNCLLVQAQPQREAHEAAKQRGDIFVGVAPGIRNRAAYSEMIQAQIKTMSFLAYVIKSGLPAIKDYASILPGVSMRLLQDCPSEAAGARKELLVAVRHILGTELRAHFAASIDTLLDDRVLLGTGITSREMHRPLAISMLADLIHHSRADLSAKQLAHIVQLHGKILHDPSLAPAIQTMCAKLLLNLVEAIITNDPEGTNRLLRQILDAFIEKMKNLPRLKSDWEVNRKRREAAAKAGGDKPDALLSDGDIDVVSIERSQPIQSAHMLLDHRESDVLKDTLFLLRNLFTGFKTILALLKRRGAPEPDADTFSTLFRAGLDCWGMVDFREQNQEKEMMDLFIPIFYDLSPPTFHEVFTTNLPFLYEMMLSNNALMGVPQNLLSMQSTSKRFVGIVLRFLADRLDELGDADRKNATVTLRLFKLAFMAVTIYPEENEQMLQPHLGYFIMHSMKLAAKATEPSNYFLLLRALFRSIGGGKFELLYKDVLPLLPVMLEQLHAFMDAAESPQRETFVDLCLTVPVRLSALLPYLGYLMKPLVLALRSSGDLLSQGLRTLELCIDNLTQEFLDPIMAPYQVDIMNALWEHLQPLPHPHAHSHTTMRILGKMGGRNRRVLQQPPKIKWQSPKDAGSFTVFFAGYGNETTTVGDAAASASQSLSLKPIVELACAHVRRGDKYYRQHSWELLKHAAALYLDGTLTYAQQPKEAMFERVVQGLFEATRVEELKEDATTYVLDVAKHIFALEGQRFSSEPSQKELLTAGLLPLTNAFFGGVAESLSSIVNDTADLEAHTKLVLAMVKATRESCREAAQRADKEKDKAVGNKDDTDAALWVYLVKRFSSKLCGLCYDKLWAKKSGGWSGVNALVRDAGLPVTWLRDNRLEIVRALVFMLKDMPTDPPRNAEAVGETLLFVLRTANEGSEAAAAKSGEGGEGGSSQPEEEREQLARQWENQQGLLTGALVGELSSSNAIVRSVTREAFKLLAEFRGQTITEILTPVKDRLLQPIFTKPLRALPFGMQIGHIDAITFCLNLEPPLPAFNEELFRVLTEACALADADDSALVGRSSQYKNTIAVTNLRIVAIKLLASALDRPEFQGPRHQEQRLRIISMYFKSLYSRSDEVVQVAFDSLRESLKDSHRLPKDVLRSGLSPILQTLADPSKLTVVGLDGLARLLKLLTTYFKVEIGSKLLSHMQHISQNVVLEKASEGDLDPPKWADAHHLLHSKLPRDSDVIETLCAIVRVFPLLPSAAVQFMDQLVSTVIDIEATLRRSGATPFTKPLATYLDKYAEPACEYFAAKMGDQRYARCFRLCVAEEGAEALRAEVTKKREKMIISLLSRPSGDDSQQQQSQPPQPQSACTALQLIQALVSRQPTWLVDNQDVFTAVKQHWRTPACSSRRRNETNAGPKCELLLLLDVFQSYLRQQPDVEAYFDLLDGFTYPSCIDMTPLLRFCYEQLAIKASTEFKRKVVERWIEVFESREFSQEFKSQALRVLVNPVLFATARPGKKGDEEGRQSADEKKTDEDKKKEGDSDGDTSMAEPAPSPPSPLFDADLFSSVVNRVWKPFQSKLGFQLCSDDGHRVELLHMSTLTLEHCVDLLISQGGNRRETIKFGWAHIASEDATVKNAAYVFISRFLEYCDSPMKIVGQVYTGMLRSEKPEGRALLRRALDILVPALPTRVQAPNDGGPPLWVKWTKSLLATEAHTSAVLMNILNLLVRHADQFYPYRDSFVPHMPACLARFGSGQTLEQKLLAIDVVDLIVRWEKKRIAAVTEREKAAAEKQKEDGEDADAMDVDDEQPEEETTAKSPDPPTTRNTRKRAAAATAADGEEAAKAATPAEPATRKRVRMEQDDDDKKADKAASPAVVGVADQHAYSVPKNVREALVTFLLRSICFSTDSMNRGPVGRAFFTYREIAAMGFWNVCDIKLNIFQRPLMAADLSDVEPFGNAFNIVCNSLQALRVICKEKSDAWFVAHAPQLCKLLEKSVRMKQPIVIELTRSILERVFEAVPDIQPEDKDAEGEEDDDGSVPPTEVKSVAAESKSTHHEPEEVPSIVRSFGDKAIQDGFADFRNPYAAFVVLGAWAKSKPERIDAYLSPLIKALSRFTKDHLAQQQQQAGPGGAIKAYGGVDAHVKLLLMALDLTKTRISHLGDQRRWWLSAAVQLGEKSSSIDVCRFLLNTLSKWVLEGKEQFPTVKEKAGLLVKMITFENRDDDELLKEYLELIYSIYTSPQLARTELTVKLEPAFLLGCRHSDPQLRQKFLDVFDRTLIKAVPGRLQYLLGQQSWEHMAEHFWITQVLDLLLGSIDGDKPLVAVTPSLSSRHGAAFVGQMKSMTTGAFIRALRGLVYASKESAHDIFVDVFRAAWSSLPRKYQLDVTRSLIAILTRDYHLRQVTRRPNVVQTLLDSAQACRPQPELPPHVVKYLGKTFQAWHTSVDLLQNLINTLPREDDSIREATLDAQAEMFAELAEEDAFYGLWRRRCVYAESNSAIAYEQSGMWAKAQVAYENAQMRARSGVLTFTEAEYSLWEDHWVICAQKLQQWEILTDLAKLEGNHDLLLECAWRLSDWLQEKDYLEQALDSLSAVPTPRRRVFAAFMALLKQQDRSSSEFGSICDEAIQLSLRKWHSLPSTVTQAHVPLLQIFQQFIELQEASTIFTSLAQTNAANIDQRSSDLKTLMQTWRERLPNLCDDINAWSDLVAWRQHVFSAVNKAYLPLVPHLQQNGAQGSSTNSYAYRGYHETAWIINRFAHVARKHHLNDVCISSLTKIYTLPNIEIQEAFLKLREQAKCHYQNPAELGQGLEVINNTNLMFFAAPQKAEFFTLKGMFMEKLGLSEDANHAFATAIQMDLGLGKAWIEWGRYNERMLRNDPANGFYAGSATSCYLQAASLYKNSKVRKVLVRVLWLLGAENSQQAAIQAFESFRGEHPTWYWVTFIPQLLAALNHREVVVAKRILVSIAKSYPQALYYSVRTTREEYNVLRRNLAAHRAYQARQQMERAQQAQQAQRAAAAAAAATQESSGDGSKSGGDGDKTETSEKSGENKVSEEKKEDEKKEGGESDKVSSSAEGQDKPADGAGPDDKMDTDAKPSESSDKPKADEGKPATPAGGDDKEKDKTAAPAAAPTPAPTSAAAPSQAASTSSPATNAASASGPANTSTPGAAPGTPSAGSTDTSAAPQPWDHVDGVINVLKTAFPLLALTMENMAEQIIQRFKASAEEDLHRLMNALLSEAMQQYITRAMMPDDDGSLPAPTRQNLHRFSQNLAASPLRDSFEEDFIKTPDLTLREAIKRLAQWRDRYEMAIDRRPQRYPLEHSSHFLCEFQHLKFDEVEVPGQYLEHHDNNSDFVRIARFSNTFEVIRSSGACTRRLSMLSNKGVVHMFQVSLNTPRHCRREEKTMQLFRCLNGVLERRIQTRRRGLFFETPIAVPLTTHARLMSTSAGVVSLYDVWEEHCRAVGQGKEDPVHLWVEKLKSLGWSPQRSLAEQSNVRTELLEEIVAKLCPDTVLSDYMAKSMRTPQDLWLCRKQFTLSMAANSLLSYCFFIGARQPSRFHIARDTGVVHQSDLLPAFNSNSPFKSADAVPFRLSPSMQTFIGAGLIEGAFIAGLSTMGRALTEHPAKLAELLGLFVRDDLPRETPVAVVDKTCQEIIKRMSLIAGGAPPAANGNGANGGNANGGATGGADTPPHALNNQVTIDLTNSATSIAKLALNDPLWMPWL
ncbi:hypothetical protein BDZ90DRAFT_281903 [Jaminaea rosea]|uniref:Uncharacterized protein n=1 Tax=Jaminaea rosea TaxID=1569628 RepID=A0A316UJ72_9BASI|nr:hypothetical protein BDZ90DRAFT_281903 [Jaminaea rosea]PWN24918.1 hypothetical protein BDZ90DRAFT_281903 [Jaminaea rosea]